MDITPIYDLRERIKAAAIAGTGLIQEDFRLKRAVEAMQPFKAASPVFARLAKLSESLLEEECQDREGTLLDALALSDAVLLTQGRVAVEGAKEELVTKGCGSLAADVPYSTLSTLLDALANSGNGRYSLVLDTHERQPELFEDYRVKAALVGALGASYAELADQAVTWLIQSGEDVLPLLYDGFDPKGKKEMVRRVRIVDEIAANKANDFYRKHLPQAEKEVRGALIYALRHDEVNEELLLELARTEKGNCRKMAYWALAGMDGEKTREFWTDLNRRRPQEAVTYLMVSQTPLASDITADGFLEMFLPWKEEGDSREKSLKKALPKETAAAMETYLNALVGKQGSGICEAFRLAASLGKCLDRPVEGEKGLWCPAMPALSGELGNLCFSQAVPAFLNDSLLILPDDELVRTAMELEEEYGQAYFAPALTARLLTAEAGECIRWAESRLYKESLLGRKVRKDLLPYLKQALWCIGWSSKRNAYVLEATRTSPADGHLITYSHSIGTGDTDESVRLAEYFEELVKGLGDSGLDEVLARFIRPGNAAVNGRLAEYFYKRALLSADSRRYFEPLKRCGFAECEGLLVRYCRVRGKIAFWELYSLLQQLPGDGPARAKEAQRILELVKKGDIKVPNMNQEYFESLILDMNNS